MSVVSLAKGGGRGERGGGGGRGERGGGGRCSRLGKEPLSLLGRNIFGNKYFLQMSHKLLTLSLPKVINFKFL